MDRRARVHLAVGPLETSLGPVALMGGSTSSRIFLSTISTSKGTLLTSKARLDCSSMAKMRCGVRAGAFMA
jgi:hypothetical protein